jgi:UDP-N-acetylglucosamine:LPS N-acetylglucosamine transferase
MAIFQTRPHFLKNPVRAAFMPLRCLAILLRERPETIVSTGAEVAIPFFYLGKLLFRSDLIFVETVSRIRHPSITGRVVYPVADLFLVQWPELCAAYGRRARYVGGLL